MVEGNSNSISKNYSWSREHECLLEKWIENINENAVLHENAGYFNKKLSKHYELPAVLIPLIMSPISTAFTEYAQIMKYVNMSSFIVTGVLSGFIAFYKFSVKSERHFNQASLYQELSSIIDVELSKKRENREDVFLFLCEVRNRMAHLNSISPIVPNLIVQRKKRQKNLSEMLRSEILRYPSVRNLNNLDQADENV